MKAPVTILFALALLPASSALSRPPAAARSEAGTFSRLRGEGFSGTVTVLRRGALLFQAAAGEAAPGRPFRLSTKVDIASISKPITAMAIFRLIEAGKLTLDDPLARWFPEAPPDKRAITLRQMLNHTSGLVDIPPGMTDYRPTSAAEMARRIMAEPLDFAPGTKNSYSNSGFNLLGMVVEKASGRPFFDYLQTEVFARAGIAASYDPEAFPDRDVASAVSEETRRQTVRELAAARKGPFWGLWGAGGVFMSAPDLAKLFTAFWNGRIVSRASVERMIADPYPAGDYAGEGLGWTLIRTDRGETFVSYTGGSEHSRAAIRYYPNEQVTVAALSNSKSPGAIRVARELAEPLVGRDFAPPAIPATVPPLAQARPEDVRLVQRFFAVTVAEATARRTFVERTFSPRYRSEIGDGALADKLAGLSSLWRPRIVSVYRTEAAVVGVFETQESEHPRVYTLTLAGSPGAITGYTIKRLKP